MNQIKSKSVLSPIMERTLDSNSINNNSFGSSKKSIATNIKTEER